MSSNFRKLASLLVKAQIASDSGKGFTQDCCNHRKAVDMGYDIKDVYLAQAVRLAKTLPGVEVWTSFDGMMSVIGFDLLGFGQMSFHSHKIWRGVDVADRWNGIYGGSLKTASRLSKKFGLGAKW